MAVQHLLHIYRDAIDAANVLIAKANLHLDPPVVHAPRVLYRSGGKHRIWDKQRTPVECADARVIPADAFHSAFKGGLLDPVPFSKWPVEKQHQTRQKILGYLLRTKTNTNSSSPEHSTNSCRGDAKGKDNC